MGLDAVVYKNWRNLPAKQRVHAILVDVATGEWEHRDSDTGLATSSVTKSAAIRIGNVVAVASLRAEVQRNWPDATILLSAVLHNGSHSGDAIAVKRVIPLQSEIGKLMLLPDQLSAELRECLEGLSGLAKASLTENNPIVFV